MNVLDSPHCTLCSPTRTFSQTYPKHFQAPPAFLWGPPYLQPDASRKHCHQRHHGESPICDFCCQLGLSNLWVLSEQGSERFCQKKCFETQINAPPKICKMFVHSLSQHEFDVTEGSLNSIGSKLKMKFFPAPEQNQAPQTSTRHSKFYVHKWRGHYGSGLLVTSCHTTTVSGSPWLLQS